MILYAYPVENKSGSLSLPLTRRSSESPNWWQNCYTSINNSRRCKSHATARFIKFARWRWVKDRTHIFFYIVRSFPGNSPSCWYTSTHGIARVDAIAIAFLLGSPTTSTQSVNSDVFTIASRSSVSGAPDFGDTEPIAHGRGQYGVIVSFHGKVGTGVVKKHLINYHSLHLLQSLSLHFSHLSVESNRFNFSHWKSDTPRK